MIFLLLDLLLFRNASALLLAAFLCYEHWAIYLEVRLSEYNQAQVDRSSVLAEIFLFEMEEWVYAMAHSVDHLEEQRQAISFLA